MMRMRLPDLLEIYDAQGVQRCGGCDLTYDDVRCTLVLCPDSLDVQLLAQTTPLRFVRLRWAFAHAASVLPARHSPRTRRSSTAMSSTFIAVPA